MKDDQKKWWHLWAPYWAYLEDRHLSVYETEKILGGLVDPILVVGAGQGLVVEYLKKKEFRVSGVDIERQMALFAKKRRNLTILQADAKELPIKSATYNTAILATGVVDYMADDELVLEIIGECKRVLKPKGGLIISFYKLTPQVERAYRNIGVVTPDNRYRIKRIFELFRILSRPFSCMQRVSKWTGKNLISAFFHWTKLGITLPEELKEEQNTIEEIVKAAANDGVTRDELYSNTPDNIPYRKESEIEDIMRRAQLDDFEILPGEECITVRCEVTGIGAGM